MMQRIGVCLVNIFCPPLAVMLIAGPGTDCLINTILFIAGVIPGHLHGFYISWTYFNRKRKVRKGRWPGGRKDFIYSSAVLNGGASNERVRELWKEKCRKEGNEVGAESRDLPSEERVERRQSVRESGGNDRAWDGRRESKRACGRTSLVGERTNSVRETRGRLMTEVQGGRM